LRLPKNGLRHVLNAEHMLEIRSTF
jgi:hypothetical protein